MTEKHLAEIDTLLASYDCSAEEWSAQWMEHRSLLQYRAKIASEIEREPDPSPRSTSTRGPRD